jgi:hypothetical protein
MTWWAVMLAGAVFILTPGMVDPMNVITGSTIVGLVLVTLATYNLTKGSDR